MPIPILEDFFPPKNLRNFTPPSRPSPKFGSVVEPTKLVPKANKVDQISAVPNIPSVISCDSARSTAISSVENASSNPQPPSLPPKLRSALSNRPQSFTKGSPCGSVALHRSSTDYSSLHHHNGLSVGLVFPSDSLNEKPFAGKFISCDLSDSPSWFGTDRGLLKGSTPNINGQKINMGPPMIYECINEMEDFVETKGIASNLASVTVTPYWPKSPIFDQTESAGGSGSPEIPYGSDTLKRAAKTNREVSRELFKKMEESRTGAAKKPLRNSQSDSPLEQKYSFVALSAVQSDPEMISSPTKLIRLPSSSSSSYRSSPKGSEKCRTATSSTTGSPNLTCRSRCSDTSGYSASRSSGEPTSEDLDWNRPQQRGNIISFCADELMDNTEEGENVFSDAGTPVPPGKTRFSAPTADYESVGDGYLGEPEEFLSATMDQMKFHFEPDQSAIRIDATVVEHNFDMVHYAVPDKAKKRNLNGANKFLTDGNYYEDFVFSTGRCAPLIPPPPLPSVPPPMSDDENDGEIESVLLVKEENFYEEMNQSKSSPEGWAEEDTGTNAGRVGYDPSWFNQRQAHGKPTPPRPPPKVVQVHPYQQNSISPTSSSPSTDSLKSPSPKLAMKSAVSHGALNSVGRTGSPLGQCKSPPPPLPPKPNIAAIQQMFGGSQSDLKNLSTAAGGKIVLKRSDNGEKIKTPQGTFSMATGKLGNVPMVVNRDQNDNTYATQSRPSVPKSQPFVVQNGNSHVDVNGGQPLHRSQVTVNVVNLSQDQNHSNGVAEIDGRAQKIRRGSIDAKCEMLKAYLVENTDDVQLRNILQNERCTSVEYLETVIKDSPRNGGETQTQSGTRCQQLPTTTAATIMECVGTGPTTVQNSLPESASQKIIIGAQQNAEVRSQISELEARKADLITSLTRKLKILEVELNSVKEEIDMNEKLGESVLHSIEISSASEPQKEKFLHHMEETNSILQLLLKLSSQLVKIEDTMKSLTADTPAHTKQSLHQRHKRLTQQLQDAKTLKESIDRRSDSISAMLKSVLTEEQFQDYMYFIRQKSKLVMDANEISEKIKIGEQQKRALEQFSHLNEAKIVMRV